MKKILALILVALFGMALMVGCGGAKDEGAAPSEEATVTAAEGEATVTEAATGEATEAATEAATEEPTKAE